MADEKQVVCLLAWQGSAATHLRQNINTEAAAKPPGWLTASYHEELPRRVILYTPCDILWLII